MTLLTLAWLLPVIAATSLVSGVFGMAGGMILMAVLVGAMPVAAAMVLHGVTQMAANGGRALLWRQRIAWPILGAYSVGLLAALGLFGLLRYVPDRGVVLISLGLLPFVALAVPPRYAPQADRPVGAFVCGVLNGAVQMLAGVSGPLLDVFFVRSRMDRRDVVATKAACQTLAHATKLVYFAAFAGAWHSDTVEFWVLPLAIAAAFWGTHLSRTLLERMSDVGFRRWTRRIIMAIGVVCLAQGVAAYL
ncbi:TSUP family transporter [Verticiella sediminum]|uniref:Probable membrane transporter protein n=1 Tax=Verticiella sediminum TaxID=1247510 RepID=A0A556AFE0_9BURK|nr:TSUP family transporter [Verticiella sediminum]TSH91601.1 TSUP family transporter [Verticiella sediminum]